MKHWKETELLIRESVATVKSSLSNEIYNEVLELLDHNELGLGLETLVDIIYEENVQAPKESIIKMIKAAKLMGFDKELEQTTKYWSLLQNLDKKS